MAPVSQLGLASGDLVADGGQIEAGLAQLGEDLGLFLVDMVSHVLAKYAHGGIEQGLIALHADDLRDQRLGDFVLDQGFVNEVLSPAECGASRRIEHLFLDGGVNDEQQADLGRQHRSLIVLGFIVDESVELVEEFSDFPMIGNEHGDGVFLMSRRG